MIYRNYHVRLFALYLGLGLLVGCAKLDLADKLPWAQPDDLALPHRILPMWSETVRHERGYAAVRGFGGRIFFYGEDDRDPVKVDGSLTVYAFDAEELNPEKAAAKKQYVFTADQFARHHSKCKLGHSYSVWLPWDKVGGVSRQISLVVRFEGRNGGVVISEPATKLLPGLTAKADTNSATQGQEQSGHDPNPVRSASYESPDALEPARRARPSSTIDLPPSFSRHLHGSEPLSDGSPWERLPTRERESPDPLRSVGAKADRLPAEGEEATAFPGARPSGPPPADSAPPRFPAPFEPSARPTGGFWPRQPIRARWPSGLGSTPQSPFRPDGQRTGPIGPSPPSQ
jgi:hypothetical protein